MSEEVEQAMGRDEAERLTERLRMAATSFVDAKSKLQGLIGQAQRGRAWEALGFRSWTEYVSQVFSDTPLMRLSRDERRELVSELSEAGMSTRAIAPIVGRSIGTVHSDQQAGVQNMNTSSAPPDDGHPDLPPQADEGAEDEPVEIYQPFNGDERRTMTFEHGAGFVEAGERLELDTETTVDIDTGEVVAERRITGVDGKTYPAPARSQDPPATAAPKRKPITDQFLHAVVELNKAVERLRRLSEDDRFPRNRSEVASRYGSDLERAAQAINHLRTEFH